MGVCSPPCCSSVGNKKTDHWNTVFKTLRKRMGERERRERRKEKKTKGKKTNSTSAAARNNLLYTYLEITPCRPIAVELVSYKPLCTDESHKAVCNSL